MDLSIFNDPVALINSYGPVAVLLLLLLPLGEEIIIVPAGFLIGQGHLDAGATFLSAYVGAFCSDAIWYFICRRYGTPILHVRWFKRMAHPRRLLQAKHQIEKRGAWLVVTARFVPGTRTSVMIASGLLHMPVWKFALAEGLTLLITIPLQLGLGWLIAHQVGSQGTAGVILTIIGVIVAILLLAFGWQWIVQHRRSGARAPRSRAAWLRRFRPKRPLRRLASSKRIAHPDGSAH